MLANSRSGARLLILALTAFVIVPASLPAQTRTAAISINANAVENEIPPGLFGQFIEDMFEGVEGPLWDELIRNRGFEEPANAIGLSRFWERAPDDRNHDPAVTFAWDDHTFYPPTGPSVIEGGGHSMRVDIAPDQWDIRQTRGISQGRLRVMQGLAYKGYVWVKGNEFDGYVSAALEQDQPGGRTYASLDIPVKKASWTKYAFTLSPNASDPLARFSLLFHGTGRIWIDQVSLMPGDTVDGARAEVYERVKELKPSFIRWPGGNVAQTYHWKWGVGSRDQRPYWFNRAWWNTLQASDFGTDEFIRLCRQLGTEPSITVNVDGNGATPEEAAAWVEYVNGPADSANGQQRAANGHPEPYHVKFWEIGNEVFGSWEIGHTTADAYAKNFNRYVAAMKAVDPTIEVIACGSEEQEWNRVLLKQAGSNIDYLAIHHYYGYEKGQTDPAEVVAHPRVYGPVYDQLREMIHDLVPGKKIHLSINEWNTALPVPAQHTMISGLYAARMMNNFERAGDVIAMTSVSDLVNGWSGGVIQSARDGAVYVTPTYLVNKLYSEHLGTQRLAAQIESPTDSAATGGQSVPYLDAVVSRSADGRSIFILAANTNLKSTMEVSVSLSGVHVAKEGRMEVVSGESPDSLNDFSSPESVALHEKKIEASDRFKVKLAPASVASITLLVK